MEMTICWVHILDSLTLEEITIFLTFSMILQSESASINTQFTGLWDTLPMMMFTKYIPLNDKALAKGFGI